MENQNGWNPYGRNSMPPNQTPEAQGVQRFAVIRTGGHIQTGQESPNQLHCTEIHIVNTGFTGNRNSMPPYQRPWAQGVQDFAVNNTGGHIQTGQESANQPRCINIEIVSTGYTGDRPGFYGQHNHFGQQAWFSQQPQYTQQWNNQSQYFGPWTEGTQNPAVQRFGGQLQSALEHPYQPVNAGNNNNGFVDSRLPSIVQQPQLTQQRNFLPYYQGPVGQGLQGNALVGSGDYIHLNTGLNYQPPNMQHSIQAIGESTLRLDETPTHNEIDQTKRSILRVPDKYENAGSNKDGDKENLTVLCINSMFRTEPEDSKNINQPRKDDCYEAKQQMPKVSNETPRLRVSKTDSRHVARSNDLCRENLYVSNKQSSINTNEHDDEPQLSAFCSYNLAKSSKKNGLTHLSALEPYKLPLTKSTQHKTETLKSPVSLESHKSSTFSNHTDDEKVDAQHSREFNSKIHPRRIYAGGDENHGRDKFIGKEITACLESLVSPDSLPHSKAERKPGVVRTLKVLSSNHSRLKHTDNSDTRRLGSSDNTDQHEEVPGRFEKEKRENSSVIEKEPKKDHPPSEKPKNRSAFKRRRESNRTRTDSERQTSQGKSNSGSLLVGAIDIGTTYSGWSFSFREVFEKDPTKVYSKTQKVPTCVLIKPDGETLHSFGKEAETAYSNLAQDKEHRDWYFFRRFKMMLFSKTDLEHTTMLKDISGTKTFSAIKVFSLAIRYMKYNILEESGKTIISRLKPQDVHWVLTVPAIWTDAAQSFMRKAAEEAGISKHRLSIALEPDAASLYCRQLEVAKLEDTTETTFFKPGTKYIVVDAGGGTVDTTVHQIINDRKICELHKASGGAWGGIRVDEAFQNFLETLFGKRLMRRFERKYVDQYMDLFQKFEDEKRKTTSTNNLKTTLHIPQALAKLVDSNTDGVKACIERSRYKSELTVTSDKLRLNADLMRSFFAETVEHIGDHIAELLKESFTANCEAIVLVGGFSDCPLLQNSIKDRFGQLNIIIPGEAGLAVLKGAVIFGHSPDCYLRKSEQMQSSE